MANNVTFGIADGAVIASLERDSSSSMQYLHNPWQQWLNCLTASRVGEEVGPPCSEDLPEGEIELHGVLLSMLLEHAIDADKPNEWTWRWGKDGQFSVSSTC